MNVYQKLQDARLELQSTEMKKSGHNKFAGYYYFELGDFLQPIQKIFKEKGLFGAVSFQPDIATLTITNMDDPKETIVFTSPMGSANLKGCHEVQNIGAVETYQRRYLWVTALEIVEHDALDATTGIDDKEKQAKSHDAKSAAQKQNQSSKPREENAFDDLENSEFNGSALAMMEQLKAAQTIPDLTKIMNSLQDKKPYVETFNKRMAELKGNK